MRREKAKIISQITDKSVWLLSLPAVCLSTSGCTMHDRSQTRRALWRQNGQCKPEVVGFSLGLILSGKASTQPKSPLCRPNMIWIYKHSKIVLLRWLDNEYNTKESWHPVQNESPG